MKTVTLKKEEMYTYRHEQHSTQLHCAVGIPKPSSEKFLRASTTSDLQDFKKIEIP